MISARSTRTHSPLPVGSPGSSAGGGVSLLDDDGVVDVGAGPLPVGRSVVGREVSDVGSTACPALSVDVGAEDWPGVVVGGVVVPGDGGRFGDVVSVSVGMA